MSEKSLSKIISDVTDAVKLRDPASVTSRIKEILKGAAECGEAKLPAACDQAKPDCYARRLIHRDDKLGFVIVAMTWGPGQGTAIHDHSGIWCVEGVVKGRMKVTHYDLVGKNGTSFKLNKLDTVEVGIGSAGALIPPHEHHVLANALPKDVSVTLHVYGSEMTDCNVFLPQPDGTYRRETRPLTYAQ